MSAAYRRRLGPEILYLDRHLLVIDKPAGLPATRARSSRPGLPELGGPQTGLPDGEPVRLVHRLPEQASGVVVYARTLPAHRNLTNQFASGRAQPTYLVLVSGYVENDCEIQLPLYYDKRLGRLRSSRRRGRPALTHCRVVERVAGNTLLECRPQRERGEQLRAHLAAIGHPLSVDLEFGGGPSLLLSTYKPNYRTGRGRSERPLVERLTMHLAVLSLNHPATGEPLRFAAPLPKDLRAALTQLRRLK